MLDGKTVQQINSDLTSRTDVTEAIDLIENKNLCFLGVMKAGPFDIGDSLPARCSRRLSIQTDAPTMMSSSVGLGHRKSLDGQRICGSSTLWPFPSNEPLLYEAPFEYVRRYMIKPLRDENRDSSLQRKWWLHGRSRPDLRAAIANTSSRCIVTPEVAKHRVFVWMDSSVLPDPPADVFARSDHYFFGLVHSRSHELWRCATARNCARQRADRYTPTNTFETFPFPWPPGREPQDDPRVQAIAEAAADLVAKRDAWLNPPGASDADEEAYPDQPLQPAAGMARDGPPGSTTPCSTPTAGRRYRTTTRSWPGCWRSTWHGRGNNNRDGGRKRHESHRFRPSLPAGAWSRLDRRASLLGFIPDPLPPIRRDGQLTRLNAGAERAVGELAGLGRMLPNPHLFIRPFLRREAVLSSRIEGTQSDLTDLYLYEGGQMALPGLEPADPAQADVREVYNYVQALEYGLAELESGPVNLWLMRNMHKLLFQGVRGQYRSPGEFRATQNWIGGDTINSAMFVPPPAIELQPALDALATTFTDRTTFHR